MDPGFPNRSCFTKNQDGLRSLNGAQRQPQQAGTLTLFTQKASPHTEQITPRDQPYNYAAAAIEYRNAPDIGRNHAVSQIADQISA